MSHGQRSSRAKRLLAARRRRPRLARLAKVAGSRAKLIVTSGVIPAALYGAEVHGVSDMEYLNLQRTAASAMRPTAGTLILYKRKPSNRKVESGLW